MIDKRKFTVTVLYKSGNSITTQANEVKFARDNDGDVSKLTVVGGKPDFLYAGLANIEAIWYVQN